MASVFGSLASISASSLISVLLVVGLVLYTLAVVVLGLGGWAASGTGSGAGIGVGRSSLIHGLGQV